MSGPAGAPGAPGERAPRRRDNRAALVRLGVVLAGIVVLAIVLHGLAVLVVVAALVAMVMVHEGGHFLAAKVSGMKVTEYFLGFGPRVWSVRRGETDYGVKAIPAGGYVRIVGMTTLEEVAPEDEARSYREATFPRRLLVAVAGSVTHFVVAFGLLWGMLAVAGLPTAAVPQVLAVTNFANGPSPARVAGLRAGDVIVAVDGHAYANAEQFVRFIRARPGERIVLTIRRGGARREIVVRTVDGRHVEVAQGGKDVPLISPSAPPTGVIGVELQFLARNETVNPFVAIGRAGSMLASVTAQTATGLTQVFSPHGLGDFFHQVATAGQSPTPPSGSSAATSSSGSSQGGQLLSILGAVQVGAQAARQNVSELLYILVAINVFVGMINLFPMLPLDGGHVAIAVYERIRSRPGRRYHADVARLMPVAYLLLAFMVVLGVGALYVNIVQPARLPGG